MALVRQFQSKERASPLAKPSALAGALRARLVEADAVTLWTCGIVVQRWHTEGATPCAD